MTPQREQRSQYKGVPPRAWIRIQLVDRHGTSHEMEMMADTGNPCAVIISESAIRRLRHRRTDNVSSNFGDLLGGWLHVVIPDIGLSARMVGYGSDQAVSAAEASDLDFQGLIGLPLLRMFEYGGDADEFWIRSAK